MSQDWHTKAISETLAALGTLESGLSQSEAEIRFKKYGANKLPEGKTDSLFVIFLRQFQSPLIYILFAASVVIFFMGEFVDASVILFVLLFNAAVGAFQEGKSQNTLLALKKFTETKAIVLRDGKESIIPDALVVPGDIIILTEGEKIPADARLLSANNLKIAEASLTGESEPVLKTNESLNKKNLTIGDQRNMVFKGTNIVLGAGRAVVVATGLDTFVGGISKKISTIDTEIPLKADIRNLSRLIIFVVLGISSILFISGVFMGKSAEVMFTTVVSLSVSIIPEGLPIVLTLVLATGVLRMSRRNALVKKLQAVESLGQTRIIAVDKTGTITKNEMVIQKIYAGGKNFDITGVGYENKGEILYEGRTIDPLEVPETVFAGRVAAFCANAKVMFSEEEKAWKVHGDPTEAAMLVLADKMGLKKDKLERESPVVAEIPFDYRTKYHVMVHKINGESLMTVVGAPEIILNLCNKLWQPGKANSLSDSDTKELESVSNSMSARGLRVLAFAVTSAIPKDLISGNIGGLTFGGFFGMKDALRGEVKDSISLAEKAGIKVVMITGDHKITAEAIAREAGIYKQGDRVLSGADMEEMSDSELYKKISKVSVFARVTPDHKLRIINAFRHKGEIIAMTGDGVNDAPSLVAADLGIGMGKIGTEVAKEASDIVLLDDNFSSILAAVEEGRSIYKTIKKVILYLFSTSLGEVLVISVALFIGWPLPILAAQIIWLNFVTDGFLDVALAMEPKEKNLLAGRFARPNKYLVDKLMIQRMLFMAMPMMIGTLLLFGNYLDGDMTKAWTISLTTLAVFQWFNAWNCRSEDRSIFSMNPFSNRFLVGATAIVLALQMLVVYSPVMQKFMRTTALGLEDWIYIVLISSSIIFVEEVRKFIYRRRKIK